MRAPTNPVSVNCVGTGVLDRPQNELTSLGKIADKQLSFMSHFYDNISVDKYVIMPNHIHLLLTIKKSAVGREAGPYEHRVRLCKIKELYKSEFVNFLMYLKIFLDKVKTMC